jgi:hypothetical protein
MPPFVACRQCKKLIARDKMKKHWDHSRDHPGSYLDSLTAPLQPISRVQSLESTESENIDSMGDGFGGSGAEEIELSTEDTVGDIANQNSVFRGAGI